MNDMERRAIEALSEIVAEIDNGHLGRLTRIEGMKGWQESFGTELAREVLSSVRPCCGGVTYHFDGCAEDGRTA